MTLVYIVRMEVEETFRHAAAYKEGIKQDALNSLSDALQHKPYLRATSLSVRPALMGTVNDGVNPVREAALVEE